jgi:hypothetical protein
MKLEQATSLATTIARLLMCGSRGLGRTTLRDLGAWASYAFQVAADRLDVRAINPQIREILIFGSVARGQAEVGDIDLIVFDDGFYSGVLKTTEADKHTGCTPDLYACISGNLRSMLLDFFLFTEEDRGVESAVSANTDLHVLPITLLTEPMVRKDYDARHRDPKFFDNAFSNLLRFDIATDRFQSVTIEALRTKYRAELGGEQTASTPDAASRGTPKNANAR